MREPRTRGILGHLVAVLCIGSLALSVACAPESTARGTPSPDDGLSGRLVLTGSSTVAPLALEIAKRFEKRHPGVRIDVQTGGSSRGIEDVRQGLADIGMASRALKQEESDLFAFQIAGDGLAMIIHADNPVTSLNVDQIRAIYTGRIETWKEIEGPDGIQGPDEPIVVVHKAEGRATLELFLKFYGLDNRQVQADSIVGDNEQGVKTIAGLPNAVGYVSIGTAERDIQDGIPIRALPSDGIEATTANLASGAYPLSRPLNLVTRLEPQGLARAFLDFARSSEVDDLVTAQYFVPPPR